MKKIDVKRLVLFSLLAVGCYACGKLDYQDREYYKQTAFIISSESTSATERNVANLNLYTFTDTLKVKNDAYDMDTIWDEKTYQSSIVFKVGIGGSQPAKQDIEIVVDYDQEQIDDYNTLKHLKCKLPDQSVYKTNVKYDKSKGGFPIIINKGTASSSLIFIFDVPRSDKKKPCANYINYAIALKIVSASDGIETNRQYNKFMAAQFTADVTRTVNWSGFPIPKVPAGRYFSVRLKGNGAENTDSKQQQFMWKYILPLEDPNTPDDKRDPQLAGKYMIFGTGVWSWSIYAYHGAGWMWSMLQLEDQVAGTYIQKPILAGDPNFPARTFDYGTVQKPTSGNKYDPKLKQLTVAYSNVIGQNYNDVLTYVGEPVLDVAFGKPAGDASPESWAQLKAKGYKYWVPKDQ